LLQRKFHVYKSTAGRVASGEHGLRNRDWEEL
jgi:hypothetical protein